MYDCAPTLQQLSVLGIHAAPFTVADLKLSDASAASLSALRRDLKVAGPSAQAMAAARLLSTDPSAQAQWAARPLPSLHQAILHDEVAAVLAVYKAYRKTRPEAEALAELLCTTYFACTPSDALFTATGDNFHVSEDVSPAQRALSALAPARVKAHGVPTQPSILADVLLAIARALDDGCPPDALQLAQALAATYDLNQGIDHAALGAVLAAQGSFFRAHMSGESGPAATSADKNWASLSPQGATLSKATAATATAITHAPAHTGPPAPAPTAAPVPTPAPAAVDMDRAAELLCALTRAGYSKCRGSVPHEDDVIRAIAAIPGGHRLRLGQLRQAAQQTYLPKGPAICSNAFRAFLQNKPLQIRLERARKELGVIKPADKGAAAGSAPEARPTEIVVSPSSAQAPAKKEQLYSDDEIFAALEQLTKFTQSQGFQLKDRQREDVLLRAIASIQNGDILGLSELRRAVMARYCPDGFLLTRAGFTGFLSPKARQIKLQQLRLAAGTLSQQQPPHEKKPPSTEKSETPASASSPPTQSAHPSGDRDGSITLPPTAAAPTVGDALRALAEVRTNVASLSKVHEESLIEAISAVNATHGKVRMGDMRLLLTTAHNVTLDKQSFGAFFTGERLKRLKYLRDKKVPAHANLNGADSPVGEHAAGMQQPVGVKRSVGKVKERRLIYRDAASVGQPPDMGKETQGSKY
jgi:hypothetical protein